MFEKLFDVFSRRDKDSTTVKVKPLTKEFRNRVLMLLRDELKYDFTRFLVNSISKQLIFMENSVYLNHLRVPHQKMIWLTFSLRARMRIV